MSERIRDLIDDGELGTIRLANAAISRARQFTAKTPRLRTAA
jgi:hypothetical protein